MVICPKCGAIAEYNAYYNRYTCTRCTHEWSKQCSDERNVNLRTIVVKLSCFASEFKMAIHIPEDCDDSVEYIDRFLDGIFNDEFLHNAEWEFIDGQS